MQPNGRILLTRDELIGILILDASLLLVTFQRVSTLPSIFFKSLSGSGCRVEDVSTLILLSYAAPRSPGEPQDLSQVPQ